jgi:FMN phosphatase YigB (HAD superfamily)
MPNARPARDAQGWSSAEALILDLDGTINTDQRLLTSLHRAFTGYIAAETGWTLDVVEARLAAFRRGGWRPVATSGSEFSFLASLDIGLGGWLDRAEDAVDIARAMPADRDLEPLIAKIHEGRRIAVTTNSPWALTTAVLDRLRLTRHADLIACPRHPDPAVDFPAHGKPSAALYASVLRHFGVHADSALVIGDRYEVDIAPAAELGIAWAMVTEQQPLPDLLRTLL